MKNKVFIILILVLVLCGCNKSWENKFQVSEFNLEDDHIVGKIKNKTNQAYDLTIEFELKNGSLTLEEKCYEKIRPYEIRNLECIAYDVDEEYEVKINNIEFEEFEIPKLEYGEIDEETLEFYFEKIYNNHRLLATGLLFDVDDVLNYPYIDSIEYELLTEDEIVIRYRTEYDKSSIYVTEYYSAESEKLNSLFVSIFDSTEEIENEIKTNISYNSVINSNYISILSALNKDVKEGYCWIVDNWCVSSEIKNDELLGRTAVYSLSLRED